MSTHAERLRQIVRGREHKVGAAWVLEAATYIEELENDIEAATQWLSDIAARRGGPLSTHPEVSTPLDPREDCSLTHWCVRT